jgi:hypothetical protein
MDARFKVLILIFKMSGLKKTNATLKSALLKGTVLNPKLFGMKLTITLRIKVIVFNHISHRSVYYVSNIFSFINESSETWIS